MQKTERELRLIFQGSLKHREREISFRLLEIETENPGAGTVEKSGCVLNLNKH